MKWVYTKPIVAKIAGKLKRMLHMEASIEKSPKHHESGPAIVQKDLLAVQRCLQVITKEMINPFQELRAKSLVCISNGVCGSKESQRDLTRVKFIGEKALKTCLLKGGDKLSVKLNTFESTNMKKTFKKEKSAF